MTDAHIHLQRPFGGAWVDRPVEELLAIMDEACITRMVDLDGGWGEAILDAHLKHFKERAPERFTHFGGVDWPQWQNQQNAFGDWAAQRLTAQIRRGAEGLKIWKCLGLSVCDHLGRRVAIDDERLEPLWETAGDLKIPVLIHVADPIAFFDPLDEHNERWEELNAHPEWHLGKPGYPSFTSLIEQFERLVQRHSRTTFIGAHVGCHAENLAWVGRMLDSYANFYVDISGRIGELGRQPYSARRFFLRYADRILLGTDSSAQPEVYRLYRRFLETDDEYFNYDLGTIPIHGRWHIYGLFLPDDVLERIYLLNAEKIIPRSRVATVRELPLSAP